MEAEKVDIINLLLDIQNLLSRSYYIGGNMQINRKKAQQIVPQIEVVLRRLRSHE